MKILETRILLFLLFILLNSQLFITFTPFNLILLTKAWINFSVFKAASSSEKTMARITVEGCLKQVESRFDLVLKAADRARDLISTSAEPLVEPENDKPTIIALREIEEGVLTEENLASSDTEEVFLDNEDEE